MWALVRSRITRYVLLFAAMSALAGMAPVTMTQPVDDFPLPASAPGPEVA
jgi:hypothetical protein